MEDSTQPKRHKPPPTIPQTLTTAAANVVKEDRISDLPDSILSHILSKVPTKTALATTVLSTKWKHLFASIPNLDIDIEDAVLNSDTNFVHFMYHLLTVTLCDVPSISKFALQCNHDYGNSHIDAWVSTVLGLKVSALSLSFHVENTGVSIKSLFECETLVHLVLNQHFYAAVPDMVCLPNLKRLSLVFVKFPDFESFYIVSSGCPVLEELCLDSCEFEETGTGLLSISSPSLKFLMLNNCNHEDFYKVAIDTPSLELLDYDDYVAESYWGLNLNSLLKACIDVGPSACQVEQADDEDDLLRYYQNVAKLVAACCNVDLLDLSMATVTAIQLSSFAMPTFQNLTELKLADLNILGWEFLPHLLESAPNLETLVLKGFVEHEGCFAKFESSILNCMPMCLSLRLQSIYFEEFNGEQDELELVSYFLTTAEVLREMEFSICSSLPIEKQHSTWSKLSSLQRCSKPNNCEIRFANGILMLESFIEWVNSMN